MRALEIHRPDRRIVAVRKAKKMVVGPREPVAEQMAPHPLVVERTELPGFAALLKGKVL